MDRRGFIELLAAFPFALGMSGSSKAVETDEAVEVEIKDKKKCRWSITQENTDGSYMLRFTCGHLILGSEELPIDEPWNKFRPWKFCRSCGREVGDEVFFPGSHMLYSDQKQARIWWIEWHRKNGRIK